MDTKLKNSRKGLGIILILLIVLLPAIVTVAAYPSITSKIKYDYDRGYETENFLVRLYRGSYILYQEALSQDPEAEHSPSDFFTPQYAEFAGEADRSAGIYALAAESIFNDWNFSWNEVTSFVDYSAVVNQKGAKLSSYNRDNLAASLTKDRYAFYVTLHFDGDGDMSIADCYGADLVNLNNILQQLQSNFRKQVYSTDIQTVDDQGSTYYLTLADSPRNMDVSFAITAENADYIDEEFGHIYYYQYKSIMHSGAPVIYAGILIAAALFALILPGIKSLGYQELRIFRLPAELAVFGAILSFLMIGPLCELLLNTKNGDLISTSGNWIFNDSVNTVLVFSINVLVLALASWLSFWSFASLRPVLSHPFKYLKERSLIIRFFRWIGSKTRRLFHSMTEIDFNDKTNRFVFKVIGVNFVILAICCSFWFFGIFVLLLYSAVVFFLVKKFFDKQKNNYQVLFKGVNQMAEGNLDVTIEEDLGIFEPFKEQLTTIQTSFKTAVEEEVKSQKMKTELITNVSHDLKTPLTAIITYVNLLKNENITPEERRNYIDTLEKKSLRLKTLIEDLFEISKATSNNITLNIIDVDLIHLIKQVKVELSDKIEDSDLDFRWNLPEDRIILPLDSQKSYRVFENLIINILKYSMPRSRVYIDVIPREENGVDIMLKNMSATELNFSAEEITDRFVRGDLSRNTEGSGLGLAIAKSFVELQKGTLKIDTDGDLFKVTLHWDYYKK
ncbi:sensor histidine kinase [Anaerolentibacter hominis]|uniref:sensor histidine kinase n=1 Tax=Anaerolentibacter hominis TaxID=3079009 RepID=UPI0031B87987